MVGGGCLAECDWVRYPNKSLSSLVSERHSVKLANVCSVPVVCQHTVGSQLVVWVAQVREIGYVLAL